VGATNLCGLLNLNKPAGLTSRDVVDLIARPLRGTKVGHAGTLDPLATGVLVVCVGPATRLIEYIQRMSKVYRSTVRLGATSATLDADGKIVERDDPTRPTVETIRESLPRFIGAIDQVPPQFSAVKVGGQRAHELARGGRTVDLAARTVAIHEIVLLGYSWPRLELEVTCGGGTYIRSLARDLGEELGCGALVEVLTRSRIGPFSIDDAIDPRTLLAAAIPRHLQAAIKAVPDLVRVPLSAALVDDVAHGRALPASAFALRLEPGQEVALVGTGGQLVAIGEFEADLDRIASRRVLRPAR
jgi:tRNA pseudouridine55 synthase